MKSNAESDKSPAERLFRSLMVQVFASTGIVVVLIVVGFLILSRVLTELEADQVDLSDELDRMEAALERP